ncbi:hypothetical protein Plec18170_003205 [Paecilomyces lecythidis]
MLNYRQLREEILIEETRIIDLENAAYLPKGRCIKGMLAGNDSWRSPEAYFKARLNKPTDIFSFGIVCIYAVLGRVILGPDDDLREHQAKGALPGLIRLQRQVSYFGDQDWINGLLKHLADDDISRQVLQMLWEDRNESYIPYKPFVEWTDIIDPEFRDFIGGLTTLEPSKRLTAPQALEHPWLAGV